MKAINKSGHLKMICGHFLSKIKKKKKKLQKKFIFGKIGVGKEQPAILIKNSFVVTFHWKTNTKDR